MPTTTTKTATEITDRVVLVRPDGRVAIEEWPGEDEFHAMLQDALGGTAEGTLVPGVELWVHHEALYAQPFNALATAWYGRHCGEVLPGLHGTVVLTRIDGDRTTGFDIDASRKLLLEMYDTCPLLFTVEDIGEQVALAAMLERDERPEETL